MRDDRIDALATAQLYQIRKATKAEIREAIAIETWDRIKETAVPAVESAVQALLQIVKNIAESIMEVLPTAIEAVVTNVETIAFFWAEHNHPEWVRIYHRTKKKRIRKKYHDRIMRAFREAVANGR